MPTPPSHLRGDASSPARRPRAAPWRWLRSVLTRPLRLQRRGLQLHVVLGDSAAAADSTSSTSGLTGGAALRRDHETLRSLFAQRPELRLTLRPLAYIEQALAAKGSRALKSASPKLQAKALDQLRRLMLAEAQNLHLPELERRLSELVSSRGDRPGHGGEDFAGAVDVTEGSHSLFDEMERSWAGQIPSTGEPAVREAAAGRN